MQYRRGGGTPLEFGSRTGLRQRLAREGLRFEEHQGERGAYDHLISALKSPSVSFPVVGVALEALADYDGRVEIRVRPNQHFDHALLVLSLDEHGDTEFFDPTFNPATAGLVRESMPTARFLEWWRNDLLQPFYIGWVEAIKPVSSAPAAPAAVLSRKTLYTFDQPSNGSVVSRRRRS